MSFRRGLILFVFAIVVIPLVVVAALLAGVAEDSANGKADARLAAGLQTAEALYEEAAGNAPDQAERIAAAAADELRISDQEGIEAIAATESAGARIASVTIRDGDGQLLASSGPESAIATGGSDVRVSGGPVIGTVRVTTLTARTYLADISRLSGQEALLADDSGLLASTVGSAVPQLPNPDAGEVAEVDLGGESVRAADLELSEPGDPRVVLLASPEQGFFASEPAVTVILIVFLALAALLIWLLLRSLRRRVATMLEVAQKIGAGDFGDQVPVEGDDEMAGLARELNRMSERLSVQMTELVCQRQELERSVQRIGEAFASGLDRGNLIELVLETAVSACAAQTGRLVLLDEAGNLEIVEARNAVGSLERVLVEAGDAARAAGSGGTANDDDLHAIGHAAVDGHAREPVRFTIAVARRGDPFSTQERETLAYLIGQTAVSIENIGLHERVAAQAMTDGLTGLSNQRHFNEWIEREVSRRDRLGGELSVLMMDLDDFKLINDTHGHLVGDRVLEEVGRILHDEPRGMDQAARYGGEEFILGLPETGPGGAMTAAQRIRRAVEALTVDDNRTGRPISVTASIGLATAPADGVTSRELIAAADQALYRAKRSGKNRVVATAQMPVAGRRGTRLSGELVAENRE